MSSPEKPIGAAADAPATSSSDSLRSGEAARSLCTLVTGGTSAAREMAIAAALHAREPASRSAGESSSRFASVLLEGLPDGVDRLPKENHPDLLDVTRIAPGCVCCTGNLPMRVSLNRLLRRHPGRLFVSLASAEHLDAIRDFLRAPPYDAHLVLGPELLVS